MCQKNKFLMKYTRQVWTQDRVLRFGGVGYNSPMPHCPELLLPQAHSLPAFLASDSKFIASIGRDALLALLPRHLIGRAMKTKENE